MMVSQNNEISKLANIIKDLNCAIISLTETITSLKSSVTKYNPTSVQEADATTNIPVKRTVDDKSMNIVVYGINVSLPKTAKPDRTKIDLLNLLPVLNAVDSSIQNASIKDLYRLGKFDPAKLDQDPFL